MSNMYTTKDGYVNIYSTLNTAEAHIIQFLLRNNGIDAIIENEDMTPLFGMVAANDAEARVLVPSGKERDAAALIKNASSIELSNITLAQCRRCGEMVCDRFDYCWNCMADMKTGEPGPDMTAGAEGAGISGRFSVFLFVFLIVSFIAILAFYAWRYFFPG